MFHDHDTDSDEDDVSELSDVDADEVIALARTALGGRVNSSPPVDGDLDMIMSNLTKHPSSITKHSIWLTDTLISVSLCPVCGSIAVCVFAPSSDVIHGCIEIMERLRESPGLGGNPDHLICTYQRTPVNADGFREHLYSFSGIYWLNFEDVGDRVIHATRSIVRVLDEISGMLTDSDRARQSRSN